MKSTIFSFCEDILPSFVESLDKKTFLLKIDNHILRKDKVNGKRKNVFKRCLYNKIIKRCRMS